MFVNMLPITLCALVLFAVTGIQGRYVSEPSINGQIETNKIISTFEDALAKCQADGAVLAAPVTDQLRNAMMTLITVNNHSTPYFINAKLLHSPSLQFMTSEGVSLDDMSVSDMIEELDPRDGECLAMDSRTIRVVSCSVPLPYMCYKKNDEIIPTTTEQEYTDTTEVDTTECGTTDEEYKLVTSTGSCYKYHGDKKNWDEAEASCEAEGGYLAILNNKEEVQAIGALDFPTYTYGIFIGLRDKNEDNHWTSVHGDNFNDIFHEWHIGHVEQTTFYCATLTDNGRIDHYYCNIPRPYLCEKTARR
ncbi:macrophage mannose receptor 1-like [Anticarsia gemmatalis]|uniref:macrophage mannose receptor 1-like n=1 Tax=Anticarsia gemmatalis TaxID=129554 RepID=UPI003F75C44D